MFQATAAELANGAYAALVGKRLAVRIVWVFFEDTNATWEKCKARKRFPEDAGQHFRLQ